MKNPLKDLREEKGLSVNEMALILKMNYANYYNLENSRYGEKIPLKAQVILYQVFNLNLKEFNEEFKSWVAGLREKALEKAGV
jgi:DNA-binding XRE family transcriptional regulator